MNVKHSFLSLTKYFPPHFGFQKSHLPELMPVVHECLREQPDKVDGRGARGKPAGIRRKYFQQYMRQGKFLQEV